VSACELVFCFVLFCFVSFCFVLFCASRECVCYCPVFACEFVVSVCVGVVDAGISVCVNVCVQTHQHIH